MGGFFLGSAHTGHPEATKQWPALMQKYLPDKLLATRHKQLLNKKEVKTTFNHELGEFVPIKTGEIDKEAVSKGLDMAYKLKGSYAPEKRLNLNLNSPYKELTDEELQNIVNAQKET